MQSENENKLADDTHDDRSIEIQSVLDMDDVKMDALRTQSNDSAILVDGSNPLKSLSTNSTPNIQRMVAINEKSFYKWEMEAEYKSLMFGGVEEI